MRSDRGVAYTSKLWNAAAPALPPFDSHLAGCAVYTHANDMLVAPSPDIKAPMLRHMVGTTSATRSEGSHKVYAYPKLISDNFALPFQPSFSYSSDALSHTRNLEFLKPLMDGPHFDLEAIWDEHTHYEFTARSVEHTMSTMVQEPYVNHVPTLTGGVGRENLTAFYRDHFIFSNSADTELELISRTVGIDRVVDEFIFKFTHNQQIDWM